MSYPADIAERLICVIPTSPVKSHPSTDLIDQTIRSVRAQVGPNVLVIILADGVRPEQREMLKPYLSYVAQLRRTYGLDMHYFVMQFHEFSHQAKMLRWLLQKGMFALKNRPHLFWLEHDTPMTLDPIDWGNVLDALDAKEFGLIRFLYEGRIHPEHEHLMMGTVQRNGQNYVRTKQFSARPHVATWDFYERMLAQFSPNALTFTEDLMHSVCQGDPDAWPMAIYYPDEPRGRSFHLDGRQGADKFEGKLVF